jgi:hypothetical protein
MRPIDLKKIGKQKSVPGFRRIITRNCYNCDYLKFGTNKGQGYWFCEKHMVPFGTEDQRESIPLTVEFVCDDWENDLGEDFVFPAHKKEET